MLGEIFGMKVVTSPYCYSTIRKVVGIPDKRKPNNRRPLFRKKTIQKPLMFLVNGAVVCAPEALSKLKQIAEQNTDLKPLGLLAKEHIDKQVYQAFCGSFTNWMSPFSNAPKWFRTDGA